MDTEINNYSLKQIFGLIECDYIYLEIDFSAKTKCRQDIVIKRNFRQNRKSVSRRGF